MAPQRCSLPHSRLPDANERTNEHRNKRTNQPTNKHDESQYLLAVVTIASQRQCKIYLLILCYTEWDRQTNRV